MDKKYYIYKVIWICCTVSFWLFPPNIVMDSVTVIFTTLSKIQIPGIQLDNTDNTTQMHARMHT